MAALAKERAAAHREGQGPGAGPVQPEVHAGFGVDGRAVIIDSEVARPLIAARVRIEEEAADRRRQEWHRQKWRRERLEMSIASLRTCLVTWVAPVVVALPAIWVASQVLSSLTDAKLAGPKWPFWLGQCAAHWALRMPTPPLPWLPPIWNGLAWVPPRPIQQGD
ncbi:MAG: hypothetical protein EXR72_26355 [Myxococcales bacterium]|nr:hypothetical protein [Myxococcales bacterium]